MSDIHSESGLPEVVAALRAGARAMRLAPRSARAVSECASILRRTLSGGGKVLVFGNGGSAAEADHLGAELVGRFVGERPGLPAVVLSASMASVTAIANDYGYERVFARQIEALGKSGDLAIGLTTSGTSPNVIAAFARARELGLATIAFGGRDDSLLKDVCDVIVRPHVSEAARIQEFHLLALHALCVAVEEREQLRGADVEKVVDLDVLSELRAGWKRSGLEVVWTNGCFDVLHVGHLESLERAAGLGDVLVVGVNSDETVTALKGSDRPVFPAEMRARMVAALEVVDHVVVFGELTPEVILGKLQPEVHTKGSDYADGRKPIPEEAVIRSYGGRLEFLPYVEGISTTGVLQRIKGAS